jgi:hypothetical protein
MLAMSDALFMRRACARVSRIAGSEMDPVHVMWDRGRRNHITVRLSRDAQDPSSTAIMQEMVDLISELLVLRF